MEALELVPGKSALPLHCLTTPYSNRRKCENSSQPLRSKLWLPRRGHVTPETRRIAPIAAGADSAQARKRSSWTRAYAMELPRYEMRGNAESREVLHTYRPYDAPRCPVAPVLACASGLRARSCMHPGGR